MAHAWKACWVQALGGSNPPSSATNPGPSGSGFFYALFTSTLPALLFFDDAAAKARRTAGLKDEKSWSEPDLSALWCGKVWFKVVGSQL